LKDEEDQNSGSEKEGGDHPEYLSCNRQRPFGRIAAQSVDLTDSRVANDPRRDPGEASEPYKGEDPQNKGDNGIRSPHRE